MVLFLFAATSDGCFTRACRWSLAPVCPTFFMKNTFGKIKLNDGTIVSSVPENIQDVRGICLYDDVILLDASPKRKIYRKAYNWAGEHGGNVASVKTLFFILFHLDEINEIRKAIGQEPISRNLCPWSSDSLLGRGLTVFNYAVDFTDASVHTLVSQSALLDDCSTAHTICVCGEPERKGLYPG